MVVAEGSYLIMSEADPLILQQNPFWVRVVFRFHQVALTEKDGPASRRNGFGATVDESDLSLVGLECVPEVVYDLVLDNQVLAHVTEGFLGNDCRFNDNKRQTEEKRSCRFTMAPGYYFVC